MAMTEVWIVRGYSVYETHSETFLSSIHRTEAGAEQRAETLNREATVNGWDLLYGERYAVERQPLED